MRCLAVAPLVGDRGSAGSVAKFARLVSSRRSLGFAGRGTDSGTAETDCFGKSTKVVSHCDMKVLVAGEQMPQTGSPGIPVWLVLLRTIGRS